MHALVARSLERTRVQSLIIEKRTVESRKGEGRRGEEKRCLVSVEAAGE